jgi:VCBS repeat-containing protein
MKIMTTLVHTPHATNDYFTGYNEDWPTPIYFDVMANDMGGMSKTLYSLDNGDIISDLLIQDTARAESTSSDYSKYGAKIWITNDGKVGYDANIPAFQNMLQSLSSGETIVDSFTYSIRLGSGLLSLATTYIEIAGRNDLPAITSGAMSGAVTEKIVPTGNSLVNGIINFKDVDLSDVHSVSANGTPIGSVLGSLTANLIQGTNDATGLGGKVGWQYTVADSLIEYLSDGQTKVEQFNLFISDNHGGVLPQTITITLTGTNDLPIILSGDFTGSLNEQIAPAGNLVSNGIINFKDVDLSDIHTVSPTGTPIGSALGTLTATLTQDTSNTTGLGGQISWQYSVANSAIEYLTEGETKIEKFNITLADNYGGTITQEINITLTGINSAPIANADTNSGHEGNETVPSVPMVGNILANDTDVDNPHSALSVISATGILPGLYGDLTLNTNGNYSYLINDNHPTVDSLNIGENLVEIFNYTVSDHAALNPKSASSTLTLTIHGTNDAPVAHPDTNSGDAGLIAPLMAFHRPSGVQSSHAHSTKINASDILSDVHPLHGVFLQTGNNSPSEIPHSAMPMMLTDMLGTLTTGYLGIDTILV